MDENFRENFQQKKNLKILFESEKRRQRISRNYRKLSRHYLFNNAHANVNVQDIFE